MEKTHRQLDRYALIAEGVNEAIWVWDLRTNEIYFSPRWKSMLGYEEQEISGHFEEWETRIHPDDRLRVRKAMQDQVEKGGPFPRLEHRLRHKDGSYHWFVTQALCLRDEAGHPHRMVGSHTDITEFKAAQDVLLQAKQQAHRRQLEARYGALIENASYGISRVTEEGQFLYVNPALVSMLGYDAQEELLSKNLATDIYLFSQERTRLLGQILRSDRIYATEVTWVRKDGKPITVRLSGRALRDRYGTLEAWEWIVNVTFRTLAVRRSVVSIPNNGSRRPTDRRCGL